MICLTCLEISHITYTAIAFDASLLTNKNMIMEISRCNIATDISFP